MVTEPGLEPTGPARARISVQIREPDGTGVTTREASSEEFEPNEHGVMIGTLFVPWRRVIHYQWTMRQEFVLAPDEVRPRAMIRVVIDDGTEEPATYTVPAERFETDRWSVTMLVDRHVEPEAGVLVVQKLFVPWGRVIEFERLLAPDQPPERPDVEAETVEGRL